MKSRVAAQIQKMRLEMKEKKMKREENLRKEMQTARQDKLRLKLKNIIRPRFGSGLSVSQKLSGSSCAGTERKMNITEMMNSPIRIQKTPKRTKISLSATRINRVIRRVSRSNYRHSYQSKIFENSSQNFPQLNQGSQRMLNRRAFLQLYMNP